jgi:hypothetical protein
MKKDVSWLLAALGEERAAVELLQVEVALG